VLRTLRPTTAHRCRPRHSHFCFFLFKAKREVAIQNASHHLFCFSVQQPKREVAIQNASHHLNKVQKLYLLNITQFRQRRQRQARIVELLRLGCVLAIRNMPSSSTPTRAASRLSSGLSPSFLLSLGCALLFARTLSLWTTATSRLYCF
jgi:hypothetical protein